MNRRVVLLCLLPTFLFLALSGCSDRPSGSRNPSRRSGPVGVSAGPVVVRPPVSEKVPPGTVVIVKVSCGRVVYPFEQQALLTNGLFGAVTRKIERYGLKTELASDSKSSSHAPDACVLSVKYIETRTNWRLSVSGQKSREYPVIECQAEMEMKAPWLPNGWRSTASGQYFGTQTDKEINSAADVRDLSLELLESSIERAAFPFCREYQASQHFNGPKLGMLSEACLAQSGDLALGLESGYDYGRLELCRVENNGMPRHLGSISGRYSGNPVFINSGLVAAGTLDGRVRMLTCSATGKLAVCGEIKLDATDENNCTSYILAHQDGRLYVSDMQRVRVLDVSSPAKPRLLTGVRLDESVDGISAVGSGLMCFTGWDGLQIVRVGDGGFERIGSCSYKLDFSMIADLPSAVNGNYVYVPYGEGCSVLCFDLTNPASPKQVARILTPGHPASVATMGNRLLVADSAGGICVVDVSTPTAPRILGSFGVGGCAERVTCSANSFVCLVSRRSPSGSPIRLVSGKVF